MKKRIFLIIVLIVCLTIYLKNNKKEKIQEQQTSYNASFFEEKGEVYTDNKIIDDICSKYDIYNFNPSYIYNNLTYSQKEVLSDYKFFITKGNKTFIADGNTCKGITFYYPNEVIIIADNPNKWLNTNLTMSDKYLIHEIAHALADSECGSRKHSDDWVSEVVFILTRIDLADKSLINDIINEYGYRR